MGGVLNAERPFALTVSVVIVGAGATGLTAALAAADLGADVLVLERDPTPMGSTSMSASMIPAAGAPEQAAAGIDDNAELLADDILRKAKGRTDAALARRVAEQSAETAQWLRDRHGVPLALVGGFLYPGHSRMRMYSTPNRTGAELLAALGAAAAAAGVTVMTDARVTDLYADAGGLVTGVRIVRPDGGSESLGCGALILACCGFGGNAEMVRRYIPEIADAVYHGHPGNQGDAVRWGEALGAAVADLTAYQGHGGLAKDHGIPILWPLIMEGGIQVNAEGLRFSDETTGYSEQAARVNAQPGRFAWSVFDDRLHQLMLAFDDYREALRADAVIEAADITELAARTGLPEAALSETLATVERCVLGREADRFGRNFTGKPPLAPPYRAAKVTGALFHTQGGLVVDADARVLRPDGSHFPNLFAGGGAARGLSGPAADGYLTGNGLLTATTLGKLAGRAAARLVKDVRNGA